MADEQEPTLPRLPAVSWDARLETFSKRKRTHLDSRPPLTSTSSDPAFFSSDDDPSIDNYTHGRRKKRYAGSWYQQHPTGSDLSIGDVSQPAVKAKRTFERQFDSGVWMDSDGTDPDDSILDELELPTRSRLPELMTTPRAARTAVLSSAETTAQQKIRDCIEDGDENIDLSTLGLEYLSNTTVERLSQFSCIPTVEKGVPFEHKDPALKLYLFNNRLQHVPGAIFNLEFLTVLSLRGNELKELPPAISKLRNLTQLNVAQNALRFLPAELLELILTSDKLENLALFPNPFYRPDEDSELDGDKVSRADEAAIYSSFGSGGILRGDILARTPVQFSDTTGKIYSSFTIDADANQLQTESLFEDAATPYRLPFRSSAPSLLGEERSRVPSLLEVALQACYRAPHINELPHLLPESAPPHLFRLLQRTHLLRETGGLKCSVCKRRLVQPRAEWIEWWELKHPVKSSDGPGDQVVFKPMYQNEKERAIPFIRRGCSWKCVPRKFFEAPPPSEEMAG